MCFFEMYGSALRDHFLHHDLSIVFLSFPSKLQIKEKHVGHMHRHYPQVFSYVTTASVFTSEAVTPPSLARAKWNCSRTSLACKVHTALQQVRQVEGCFPGIKSTRASFW